MLDFDLAELYDVETRVLKQAVKRNINRLPGDFMFQLTDKEADQMVSQNVIPSKSWFGGSLPFAFTEQGVSMLSSILRSKTAIQVNISIMRAFVFIRKYSLSHKDLTAKLEELETKYDRQFKDVFDAINYLLQKDEQKKIDHDVWENRERIGFKAE